MNRVIVVGSPRVNGRSAILADELFNACIEECPSDGVSIVSVASTTIAPCTACDSCREPIVKDQDGTKLEEGDPLAPHPQVALSDADQHQCVLEDDMGEVRKHLDAADELIVVSPVFFSSVPAQFKCLLDRLQPYYRSNLRQQLKRPLILHIVGEGGDPHGFEPLITTVKSAFAVAGFSLEAVFSWVGALSEDGEFLGDPKEYPVDAKRDKSSSQSGQADKGSKAAGTTVPKKDPKRSPKKTSQKREASAHRKKKSSSSRGSRRG